MSGMIYGDDFSGALAALRDGRRVCREGRNGKGMFCFWYRVRSLR